MSLFAGLARTGQVEERGRAWPDWVLRAAGIPPGRRRFHLHSAEHAMQISTVWACVSLLSRIVAQTPLDVMERPASGGPAVEVLPKPRVIAKPSALIPAINWRYSVMVSLLLRGNAYGVVTARDPRLLYPTQIELAHPDTVDCDQPEQFAPASWKINGEPVPAEDLWHVAAFTVPGYVQGLSPISNARRSLAIADGSADYAEDFYNGGGHPTGLLATDQRLEEGDSEEAKRRFKRSTEGDRLAVLGMGWSYEQVQVSPADAAWLAARKASAVEICNYFGVQPEKLSLSESGTSVTYANRESQAIDFLTDGVQWWFTLLDDALSALRPRNQIVRHNVDAFLRVDAKTRAEVQAIRLRSGQRTPNEVRIKDDLPPYPDGLGDIPAWPPPGQDPGVEGVASGVQGSQGA